MLSIPTAVISSAILFDVCVADAAQTCPQGMTMVDRFFHRDASSWIACEDLGTPNGALALVPSDGNVVWLPKTYEPYIQGADEDYYLGLGKSNVLAAKWDMLGDAVLNQCAEHTPTTGICEPTWSRVEAAVPVMRYSQGNREASGNEFMCSPYSPESGVRTFTGSRSASVDATFSDHGDDCTDNGFPRPQGYVMNLTAIANGEPPILDFKNYVNFTAMAEGLVGGVYPNLVFYFPIQTQNFSTFGGSRYWTMIASPVPDMEGGREQSVWFRFQQLVCEGKGLSPPCKLHGTPQYYDTYWYSYSPITTRWIRPELMANASGFYSNLLDVKRFWDAELAREGMMSLSLPEGARTNGTWLAQQATFSFVRSMISRDGTWHPRYGVLPGYGITLQDGFEDTFTATATAALEYGSFPYAKGVIDNWFLYYVRDNGMVTYRAEELAQAGRILTILALYSDMTNDTELVLKHFGKARALARTLLYRFEASTTSYPESDPRYGVIAGGDEGDGFVGIYESYGNTPLPSCYPCTANAARGFEDAGRLWRAIGNLTGREDISAHGDELLETAPRALAAFRASLNRTIVETGNPRAPRCVPTGPDPPSTPTGPPQGCLGDFRGYPELMYAGVLTVQQTDDLFLHLTYGNSSALPVRPMTLGCSGYNSKQTTYTAYGMAYGLLVADMVERFLLHFFGMSAHTYTRGTWTTPEATSPDRDVGSTDFVAAGLMTTPTYLKWALVFEEPNSRTVWLAKASPREWLVGGGKPIVVQRATTRYGRVSYALTADVRSGVYTVQANLSLPLSFASDAGPSGGVRLRLRVPADFAGALHSVTVGGVQWTEFDAKAETIDFSKEALQTSPSLLSAMQDIVAKFTSKK